MGELEADASVTAGYIPLMYFLFGWVEPERQRKAITYVLSRQNPDGCGRLDFGGPGDLDVSIQCYFGLKLGGLPRTTPAWCGRASSSAARAGSRNPRCSRISAGGFGQYDYGGAPSAPPEIILLPIHFYFNIYELASWCTRNADGADGGADPQAGLQSP